MSGMFSYCRGQFSWPLQEKDVELIVIEQCHRGIFFSCLIAIS